MTELNMDFLERQYFYVDKPVPYKLSVKDNNNKEKILYITPIKVIDSEIFYNSVDLISQDKNSNNSVEIIQMSYLEFITTHLFQEPNNQYKFINLMMLCLGLSQFNIFQDDRGKPYIYDEKLDCIIYPKDFENIRRIILYQNIPHYDDSYINPEAKKAMDDVDKLRNQDYQEITLERKFAIISSHCGMTKKDQLEMTLRSHTILFEEVCGEVEFATRRNASLISTMFGGKEDMKHWIFRKKRNMLSEYFVSDKQYSKNMGGDGNIAKNNVDTNSSYSKKFNNFNK